MNNPNLFNSHLEGNPFHWKAGEVGVLLIHGFTATPAEMIHLGRALHKEGLSVAAPLLAGHGTRPEDLNRVCWQDWVASCEPAYQQLKAECQKVFLAGASMGGMVALCLAAQHLEAAGVILFAPGIKTTHSRLTIWELRLVVPFIKQVARASLDNPRLWQGYPGLPLKGAVQLFKMQKATRDVLPQINQPILVFQGRKDRSVAPEAGKIILDGVSSKVKQLVWMEQSTHEITLDDELPDVTTRVIEFIRSTS